MAVHKRTGKPPSKAKKKHINGVKPAQNTQKINGKPTQIADPGTVTYAHLSDFLKKQGMSPDEIAAINQTQLLKNMKDLEDIKKSGDERKLRQGHYVLKDKVIREWTAQLGVFRARADILAPAFQQKFPQATPEMLVWLRQWIIETVEHMKTPQRKREDKGPGTSGTCKVDGCNNGVLARGLCRNHYDKVRQGKA